MGADRKWFDSFFSKVGVLGRLIRRSLVSTIVPGRDLDISIVSLAIPFGCSWDYLDGIMRRWYDGFFDQCIDRISFLYCVGECAEWW